MTGSALATKPRIGGVIGNAGGLGKTRNEVRALLMEGAHAAIPALYQQLEGDDPRLAQGAAEIFLKYGIGQLKEISTDTVRAKLSETLEIIRRDLPPEQSGPLIAALRAVWT